MTDNPEQHIYYSQQFPPPMAPPEAPQPGVLPLRPADVGGLITGSFRAVFRNWPAALLAPFGLFLLAAGATLAPMLTLFSTFSRLVADPRQRPSDGELASFFGSFVLFIVLAVVLSVAAMVVTESMVTVVVSRAVLGRSTSIGQALRAAAPRMLPLLGLNALIYLMMAGLVFVPLALFIVLSVVSGHAGLAALGVLLAMVGGGFAVYLWISYALAPAALILEPAPVLTALRRSRWLVTGAWWRVFGILSLAGLMIYFASYLAELPVSALQFAQLPQVMSQRAPDPSRMFDAMFSPTVMVAFTLLSAVVSAISQAFMIGVTTLLYHDMRIRKESFHLPLYEMSQLPDDLSPSARPAATP